MAFTGKRPAPRALSGVATMSAEGRLRSERSVVGLAPVHCPCVVFSVNGCRNMPVETCAPVYEVAGEREQDGYGPPDRYPFT